MVEFKVLRFIQGYKNNIIELRTGGETIYSPHITVIILNYNGWIDTIECLESLFKINYPNYNVIVVDNNSQDDSVTKIKNYAIGNLKVKSKFFKYDPKNKPIKITEYGEEEINNYCLIPKTSLNSIIIIKNDSNYGFAEGNNIGIRFSLDFLKPDYILLLNNDVIVAPDLLDELIKEGEKDIEIGALGPTVYNYDETHRIQSAGFTIEWKKGQQIVHCQNKLDDGGCKSLRDVDAVSGCALLARSEIFIKVGLLKQEYFAYWEETEWCIKAKEAGYKIKYVPQAKVWHKEAISTSKVTGFLEYYLTRNLLWLMREHAPKEDLNYFWIYFFFYQFFRFGLFLINRKNITIIPYYLKGVWDGLFMNYDDT